MARPPTTAGTMYWNRPRIAAASAGTMNKRVGERGQRHDRRDQDPGDATHRGADHPVHRGETIRTDTAHVGAALVLGRGARPETERREAEQRGQPDGEGEHDRTRSRPGRSTPGRLRWSRCGSGRIGSTLIGLTPRRCVIRLVMTTITPIDATARATCRGRAQRPEHEDVEQQPEPGRNRDRQRRRGPEAEASDVHRLRQARDEQQQLALAAGTRTCRP